MEAMTPAESTMRTWLPMTEREILTEWPIMCRLNPEKFNGDPMEILGSLEESKLARNDEGTWRPWSPEEESRLARSAQGRLW